MLEGLAIPGTYRQTGKGPYRTQDPVWKAGLAVRPGDVVFRDSDGYDKPADQFAWNTDLATTLTALGPKVRGVSAAGRRTDQPADGGQEEGMVVSTGEFEFPCAALGSAASVGAWVTLAKQAGNAVERQKVAVTTTQAQAIGVLTADAPVGATSLVFEVRPKLGPDPIGG